LADIALYYSNFGTFFNLHLGMWQKKYIFAVKKRK